MKTLRVNKLLSLYAVRSIHGRMSDKFNRIQKLAYQGRALLNKFDAHIGINTATERAQCALACKLAFTTGMRVGNEDSAKGYTTKPHPNTKILPIFTQTYGITTLTKAMVKFRGTTKAVVSFLGKKSVAQTITIVDPMLVSQLRYLSLHTEGKELFTITDVCVRKYVRRYVGKAFKVKDFRTLYANMVATNEVKQLLIKEPGPVAKRQVKADVAGVVEVVSDKLGNTPGVVKRAYLDPKLIQFLTDKRYLKK